MKDIKINTPLLKLQYFISWIGFILLGTIWAWIIAVILANAGKVTSADVNPKKNVLNKTWQKWAFIYGSITGDILILIIIIGLIIG